MVIKPRPGISLTAALRDPTSCVHAFFGDVLLDDAVVIDNWTQLIEVNAAKHGRVGACGTRPIGLAIETSILADLAHQIPYPSNLALLAPEEAEKVRSEFEPLIELARTSPEQARSAQDALSGYSTPRPTPSVIHSLEAAYRWAALAEMLRFTAKDHGPAPETVAVLRRETATMPLPPSALRALVSLWVTYLATGRPLLRALGPGHVVHPSFADGAAVADLIAGQTLIDIKVSEDPLSRLQEWLQQILSYAFLAHIEGKPVGAVGIYQAADGLLVTWPLQELIAQTTSPPMDVATASQSFYAALTDERRRIADSRGGSD